MQEPATFAAENASPLERLENRLARGLVDQSADANVATDRNERSAPVRRGRPVACLDRASLAGLKRRAHVVTPP